VSAPGPRIAAVVVTYQPGPELDACLASLRAQLSPGLDELWVVDNASGDGTPERVARLAPEARVVASPENAGFAAGNNVALSGSAAAAFLLLNPDAELLPGALAALAAAAAAHPGAGAVAPQILAGDGSVAASCQAFPTLTLALWENTLLQRLFPRHPVFGAQSLGPFDHRSAREVDAASGACLFVPRRTLERVGPMDAGFFMYAEEIDWCRRMRDAGLTVWFEPAARVRHLGQRSSGRSLERLIPEYYRSQRRYFRKHHRPVARLALRPVVLVGALLRLCATLAGRLSGRLDPSGFGQRARAFLTVVRECFTGGPRR
jgi:N-acetylglucosaminyl-diphospho-decaprenol L-rhamnosyltransferase